MKSILFAVLSLTILSGCSGIAAISQPPSDSEIQAAIKINSPIAISAVFGDRNIADGIDVMITYQNIESKAIKYVEFELVLVNAVGDVVATNIMNKKRTHLQSTGPVKSGSTKWADWKAPVYHSDAVKLAILSADITYMDGTKEKAPGLAAMPSAHGVIENKRY